MTKQEKNDLIKNNLLLEAKERLIKKGYQKEVRSNIDMLLTYVRPEHMTSDTFNNKCKEVMNKYINDSKNDMYDEYEKEVIKNTASSVYEFQLKAYLTMCYY